MDDIKKTCARHGDLNENGVYRRINNVRGKEYIQIDCKQCRKEADKYDNKILDIINQGSLIFCCTCREFKSISSFAKAQILRKSRHCKGCVSIKNARYKDDYKKKMLVNKFNITQDDYDNLLKRQNNVCAICHEVETTLNYKSKMPLSLAVDHCHITNKIRGLLCRRCNMLIGSAKDSSERLLAAMEYLEKNKERK